MPYFTATPISTDTGKPPTWFLLSVATSSQSALTSQNSVLNSSGLMPLTLRTSSATHLQDRYFEFFFSFVHWSGSVQRIINWLLISH